MGRLKLQLRRLELCEEDIEALLALLDATRRGHVFYRPFRDAVAEFLATRRRVTSEFWLSFG